MKRKVTGKIWYWKENFKSAKKQEKFGVGKNFSDTKNMTKNLMLGKIFDIGKIMRI